MRILVSLIIVLAALGAAIPEATPAQAQTGVTWSVEYFNNAYLVGSPVLVRQESGMQFYWGAGSPAPEVPVDNFSARFATDAYFAAGAYRFYILADDGIKLWIDFPADKRPSLDTYNAPRPGELLTFDTTLTAGMHHIQVDYRENTGDAYVNIGWEPLASAQGPNFPTPPTSVNWVVQWTAQYFNNPALAGSPVLSQSVPAPNFNWGTGSPGGGVPADNFSARFIVYQDFAAGTYTIRVAGDDGLRVFVDNSLVINEWHYASGLTYTATFPLNAGPHSIVVEYYEATGDAHVSLSMVKEGSQPAPAPVTGATARVVAWRLNVRSAPLTGSVLTVVSRNQVYPVLGRNADSSWWQINVNGTIGWVSGRYVSVTGAGAVPVVGDGAVIQPPTPTPTPVPTYGQCPGFLPSRLAPGGFGQVTQGLSNNVRAQPGLTGLLIGRIPPGGVFQVLGGPVCASSTAWYQVRYDTLIGWTAEGMGSTYWLQPYQP